MVCWILLCSLLVGVALALCIKIRLMRKAAEQICVEFSEKLEEDTNTLISISSNDRAMRHLAATINAELRRLRVQRLRFEQGDIELKNAVTGISHDLRTPLTAIGGYLDLLDVAEKSAEAERYIGIIRNRTETLETLTEELFRYSMIISPECDEQSEAVEVNRVLEESVAGFYAVLQERKIAPEIRMPEQRVICRVNRAALARIFSNLISNALKYSDGDLEITLTENGMLTFANEAAGLGNVDVERLFDRFYTTENARKSTGLGLSIARVLTERMGGKIWAEYKVGRLSVKVELPFLP